MSRDPRFDPQPGDVITALPRLTDVPPAAPLRVVAVDEHKVHWERNGDTFDTTVATWQGYSGTFLLDDAAIATTAENDAGGAQGEAHG